MQSNIKEKYCMISESPPAIIPSWYSSECQVLEKEKSFFGVKKTRFQCCDLHKYIQMSFP
jgi:hypothetical protein